jgi:hypothetical protein
MPSPDTTACRRPRFCASVKAFSSYSGAMPVTFGSIQICSMCVSLSARGLNSECITPRPALIRCTLPGWMVEPLPMLSLCAMAPSST